MEKRNVYLLIAAVVVVVLILGVTSLTGRSVGDCLDSDNGDDPATPGSVSFTNTKTVYKDECYSSGLNPEKFVREYFCVGKLDDRRYVCDNGCTENANGEGYCNEGGFNVDHSSK